MRRSLPVAAMFVLGAFVPPAGGDGRGAADPAWLTPTVVAVAHGVYADRAFDRLPILADALMDAGCSQPDVLDHCRRTDGHVRGCWLVELLLRRD